MSITSPLDISGCQLWLDAEDSATLESGGGLTYTWTDKSGNGNDCTCQAGIPMAIVGYSGKRHLMVGGRGASGATGGYVTCHGAAATLNGSAWTVFAVGMPQVDTTSGGRYLLAAGSSLSTTPLFSILTASGKNAVNRRNDSNVLRTLTSVADAAHVPQIHEITYNGTTLSYWIDGVLIDSNTASGAISLTQLALGISPRSTFAGSSYCGAAAVVIYDSELSSGDRADVRSYLTTRHLPTITNEVTNQLPEAFRPAFCRVSDNAGVITHTYSDTFAEYDDNAATGLYYVDYWLGNDGNAGTLASPLKTLDVALAKTDVKWVKIKSYINPSGWGAAYTRPDLSVGVSVYRGGGLTRAWIANAEVGTWSLTSGQTNTYETTRTGATTRVVDASNSNSITGEPQSLTSRASIALVEANPGSYFSDSGTGKVYVHAFDSRVIDTSAGILVQKGVLDPRIPFTSNNRLWVVSGVSLLGCTFATQVWNISNSRNYFYNFENHFGAELSFQDSERVSYYRTRLTNSDSDHFDYRGDVIGLEVECVADLCAAGDANNCTTGHSSAVILNVKGRYTRGSRNVHDIDNTQRQMIDCDSLTPHSGAGGADTTVTFFCGANDGGTDTCNMWLYRCRGDSVGAVMIAELGCDIVCQRMKPSRFTQTARSPGTITFLNNLPSAPKTRGATLNRPCLVG